MQKVTFQSVKGSLSGLKMWFFEVQKAVGNGIFFGFWRVILVKIS